MRLIFIEEASRTFSSDSEGRYDLGDGPGMGFLRSARKIDDDTAVILTDQTPSKLNTATAANCSNIICFTLVDSKDLWEAGCAAGLEPHQRKELVELSSREVIVRLARYNKKPLKIQVDEITFPPALRKEQARQRSRKILDSIPYVKRAPEKVGDAQDDEEKLLAVANGLPTKEKKVYARIAELPWELIEDRMDALGLDRDTENGVRTGLQARGLIQFAGRVGAKHRLFELTPRGRQAAQKAGLTIGDTGKGSTVHECVVRYTEKSLKKYCPDFGFLRVGVSGTMDGVQPDSVLLPPRGADVPIQACHRNQPAYEAKAILSLHSLALLHPSDVDRIGFVIAVAVNKKHRAAIERAIRRENNGRMPEKVALLDFDAVIDPKFDWEEVFALMRG